jgi:hypothetical protein
MTREVCMQNELLYPVSLRGNIKSVRMPSKILANKKGKTKGTLYNMYAMQS